MLQEAQLSMRRNYINGGPGVVISGIVWLIAAGVTAIMGFIPGIITFFIGGMAIYPLSSVIENRMKQDAPPPDKGLTRLAMLSLPFLFGGLLLAYSLSKQDISLFYPVMSIAIGLRYLIFKRVYGLLAFWALGGMLILVGVCTFFASAPLVAVPLIVGIVEIGFGITLTRQNP